MSKSKASQRRFCELRLCIVAGIRKSIWQRFFGEHASMSKSKASQRRFCELGLCIVAGILQIAALHRCRDFANCGLASLLGSSNPNIILPLPCLRSYGRSPTGQYLLHGRLPFQDTLPSSDNPPHGRHPDSVPG